MTRKSDFLTIVLKIARVALVLAAGVAVENGQAPGLLVDLVKRGQGPQDPDPDKVGVEPARADELRAHIQVAAKRFGSFDCHEDLPHPRRPPLDLTRLSPRGTAALFIVNIAHKASASFSASPTFRIHVSFRRPAGGSWNRPGSSDRT